VPGEDWGPAWVDWRYSDDYVGWAPLPPDDLLVAYRDDPIYWSFVRPRFLLAPRVFTVFVPARERIVIIRRTRIVNRTVIVDRDRRDRDRDGRRGRVAVNPGIEPGIIARATGKPIRAAKVEPAVLRGTKVDGAREVDPGEGRRARASVKQSDTVIKPTDKVERPKELGADEKGRLGNRPPKAAQNVTDTDRGPGNNQSGDRGRSPPPPPPVNVIRGGTNDSGRSVTPPSDARERGNQQGQRLQSPPPPPPPPVNVIRGGSSDSGRSAAQRFESPSGDRGNQQSPRFQSPPPPPPVVYRSPPPPPPVVRRSPPPPPVMRAPPPPPPVVNRQQQDQRGNRPNNRQPDERLR
jgi:hypothetical protein